eukprot:Polyplicarium_translucidae@DN2299_c0_g1_i1.p1
MRVPTPHIANRSGCNPSGMSMEDREEGDLEFPDEVETPNDAFAHERFKKYRALKSFATSPWNTSEDLPHAYGRIYEFKNFGATVKHARAQAASSVKPVNRYTCVYLEGVSPEVVQRCFLPHRPVLISTLLPFESQVSVCHFSVTRHDCYEAELPSKAVMDVHCGFRRFETRPLFSEAAAGHSPSKAVTPKAKYLRRLPVTSGSSSAFCLSAYVPACQPGLPALFFRRGGVECQAEEALAAWGTSANADPSRLIVKRILLTGCIYRAHKRKAVVRFMFFNARDVKYFKSVELRTRNGSRGNIMSSIGTHGRMKCVFNKEIKQSDTVCLALYKRVFPKWHPKAWGGDETT